MSSLKGKIAQVIGPVVDVAFEKGVELPKIYDALEVFKSDGTRVVLEVQHTLEKILFVPYQWTQQMVLLAVWRLFLPVLLLRYLQNKIKGDFLICW